MEAPLENRKTPTASPWKTALVIAATTAVTELAIMLVLTRIPIHRLGALPQAMLDATLLGLILTPVVYYLLMAPLRRRVIREQQQKHELHDGLTGLPSRKLFMELLDQEVRLATRNQWPMALIVIDPARLSEINQIFGYGFGDKVLAEMAVRFRALLRKSDIVARISGDEFGLLLQRVDSPDVRQMVQKITDALETQFVIDGISVDIGVTMGIAMFPHHGDDPSLLLQRALVALSTAKNELETYSLFEQEYESAAEDRIRLFGEIRQALIKDEFELYFQPKVHMPSGRIVGAEALARLNRKPELPVSGLFQFAEQVGVIADITRWVFRHAVAQMAAWRSEGLELDLSVNISVRDALDLNLMAGLLTLCEDYGVSPTSLTIEITENAIMRRHDSAVVMLERLRREGFRISLDDFGTGYSSLNHLKQIPADELKIDQSFIRSIEQPGNDGAIVGLIVDIGNAFGQRVVAEGVETPGQAERLLALGCDTMQGYLISPPMPANEMVGWHRRWRETHGGR